jgi:2-dehydro-3-deoxygalactonokinase
MNKAHWIAADWGNTNLRLWALDEANTVIAERSAEQGFTELSPDEWEPLLLETCDDLLSPDRQTPVLICGAVGSRGGWVETPFRQVPCTPNGGGEAMTAPTRDLRLSVRILPGLSQMEPPAILRSEETRIAGFLSSEPEFDGVVCLPGTHTKWVHVSAGEVVSFISVMTGELFSLLTEQSILRRTIARDGHDETAFLDAVEQAMRYPVRLTNTLASLREQAVLSGLDPVTGLSRLSGLLVGADLAASRYYWLGREVTVIGSESISAKFAAALRAQGVSVNVRDSKAMLIAGLRAAYEVRS